MNELEEIQTELSADVSWKEAQKALTGTMLKNKAVFLHVYRSLDYATLEQKAFDISMKTLLHYIKAEAGDSDVEERDVKLLAELCASAMSRYFIAWVRDGMKNDPNAMIDRIADIMEGTIELAIENAVKIKKKKL